jgi:hypothetical protein
MRLNAIFRNKIVHIAGLIAGLLILSCLLGLLIAFRCVGLSGQLEMVKALFTISPVIFGILGVWVAVLDPSVVLNQQPSDERSPRTELALEFSPLLVIATFVFITVVLLRFASPLLPDAWFWHFSGRMALGTVISCLYLLELYILLMTLLPIAKVMIKNREDTLRRRYRQ